MFLSTKVAQLGIDLVKRKEAEGEESEVNDTYLLQTNKAKDAFV